jgi:hypothetical protein
MNSAPLRQRLVVQDLVDAAVQPRDGQGEDAQNVMKLRWPSVENASKSAS